MTSQTAALRVVDVGWATTIQDHGRTGWAHLGVPTAGAVDRSAHDLVNRLVGNEPSAATLETLGGLVVEAVGAVILARSSDGSRHTLVSGERLRIDAPPDGLWAYLAVRGGIDVEPVLGSRSHDTLSGVGPPEITASTVLPIGDDPRRDLTTDLAPSRLPDRAVRLWAGPHTASFVRELGAMLDRRWTVTDDVSRVGTRLGAAEFERRDASDSMRSIGLVPGAIQVTPAGEPIVMLANHPTTGGYPVIAVVDPADLALVAQARPGTTLRFIDAGPSTSTRRTT